MRNRKHYVFEVLENGKIQYFRINRFLGESSYALVENVEDATKLDEFQINYTFPFLRDKEYKAVDLDEL